MVGGNGNLHRLEDARACAQPLGPKGKTPAVVFDDDLLQRDQVLLDVGPLEGVAHRLETPLELLSEHQGQEGTERVPPDGAICHRSGPTRSPVCGATQ